MAGEGHSFARVEPAAVDLIGSLLRRNLGGRQQLIESCSVKHLGSHSSYRGEGHFGAVMCGIAVHAKRTLAEWHVDDLGDRISDRGSTVRILSFAMVHPPSVQCVHGM
jgi:hypothetical protein